MVDEGLFDAYYMSGFVLINVLNNYAQVNREPDESSFQQRKIILE